MVRKIYNCEEGCSVESTLQLISGRWKSVLLYHLIFEGEHRYNELQKKIPGITRRMLSLQLTGPSMLVTTKIMGFARFIRMVQWKPSLTIREFYGRTLYRLVRMNTCTSIVISYNVKRASIMAKTCGKNHIAYSGSSLAKSRLNLSRERNT